jgi:drug/metabolite transporter (DMT)-like permease
MHRSTAKFFGFLVLGLGLIGLIVGNKQFLEILNVDLAMDTLRLGLAGVLLYAVYGARNDSTIRTALMVFGIAYLGLGTIGIFSPDVYGLLPHQLTDFDKAFHLLGGVAALGIAMKSESSRASHA